MTSYDPKHNCIFVNVPRTGSGSISTIIFTGGHLPIAIYKDKFLKSNDEESWEAVFKFGFVRNPYDRFVSAYYNLKYDRKKGDINRFLASKNNWERLEIEEHALIRPMNEYLYIEDELGVDFLGRYENYLDDWKKISKYLNITQELPHKNKTDRPKSILSPASAKKLYDYYHKDFILFNYGQNTQGYTS